MTAQRKRKGRSNTPLAAGTIVIVHNLRNRLFLPDYGFRDVPLMVSVVDIVERSYLRRAIGQVGIKNYLGVAGPVLIDSGGYSFMTGQSAPVTVDDLVALYSDLDADMYAALDLPPAPGDSRKVRARKWGTTLSNLERMLKQLLRRQLIPVIHGHTPDEVLIACRDVHQRVSRPPIIALGGMVPFLRGLMSSARLNDRAANGLRPSGAAFVADAISICRTEFPYAHLHVFGAGSTTTAIALLALGAHSVDSLAWRRAAGFGTIFLAGLAERIVSEKRRRIESRPRIISDDLTPLNRCECPICLPSVAVHDKMNVLGASYVARAVHNVWTLQSEAAAFRDAVANGTVAAFAVSRIGERHRFARVIQQRLGGTIF
jgi:queuine/archaeosine tRNA-ribosyltransferase